jgi:hypothetical protein
MLLLLLPGAAAAVWLSFQGPAAHCGHLQAAVDDSTVPWHNILAVEVPGAVQPLFGGTAQRMLTGAVGEVCIQ